MIAASATIGNPALHAQNLMGLDFAAVREDHGPRAARELLFWRPPELPGKDARRSVNTEAADLAALFVRTGLKSIFFCNSRKTAELLRRYAAGQLTDDEAARLGSYRAGYTPEDRRKLEADFKRGDLRVLTATSALELGVDVGGVDAVVLVGYPGSMTALWQRAGRAGRGDKRALTLLIPGNDPLDEYYLNHPDLITDGRAENAVADAFNSELHPAPPRVRGVRASAYQKGRGRRLGGLARAPSPQRIARQVLSLRRLPAPEDQRARHRRQAHRDERRLGQLLWRERL